MMYANSASAMAAFERRAENADKISLKHRAGILAIADTT
jgi:hypothetical protein